MNIQFTHAELNAIMMESESFRQKILSICFRKDTLTNYRDAIRDKFPRFQSSEKIDAIKWLREDVRGKKDVLREFDALNFEVYGQRSNWDDNSTLGLAAAKRFVESC